MACAYAKWTGKLGCCLATTGPGGIHLLNGLYDAKFDRAPVLAITGLPYHDLLQTATQQDVDHVRLFQDVAEHSTAITGPRQVAQATARAWRDGRRGGGRLCAGGVPRSSRRHAPRHPGRHPGSEAGSRPAVTAQQGGDE